MQWKEVRIGDLGRIVTGTTPPTKERVYYGNKYPLIKPSDIINGQRYIAKTEDLLSKEVEKKFKRFLVPSDTTCVVTIGSIGKQCYTSQSSMTNQQINSIIPHKEKYDERFIYYLMEYNNPKVKYMSSGSASGRENVNKSAFESIKVKVPISLPTQQKIASILSTYDDLIENNQKRISILEQMAQNLYKEWFVRFRFPGHEDVEMVDGLPKGWQASLLGTKARIRKGRNITKNTVSEGEIPVVAGGVSPAYFHNKANTLSPTITVSASGANAGFVNLYFENIWASDCSFIDSEATSCFYFIYLSLIEKQKEIFHLQKGSAQPHVYPKDLIKLSISLPGEELINRFEQIVTPFYEKIKLHKSQNKVLGKIRDRLLPRLLSGKLKV